MILKRSENRSHAHLLLPAALLLTATTGCAAFTNEAPGGGKGIDVITAFYPLQFVTERVAGDHADVVNLTRPGGEPHDLELSVAQTAAVTTADLIVYEKGLQAAVDAAVDQADGVPTVDASEVAGLEPLSHDGHDDADHDDHGDEEHSDLGDLDPHFWQDPLKLAKVADAVADAARRGRPLARRRLPGQRGRSRRGPHGAGQGVRRRADRMRPRHGRRLAQRLRLPGPLRALIEPISGLSPDAEPTPADLARLQQLIEDDGITTVFGERLASPKQAQSLADDMGVTTGSSTRSRG